MPRVYLTLLPLPVLAAIVAFSACSRSAEPATHVIPAAAPYAAASAPALPPAAVAAAPDGEGAKVAPRDEDTPSEDDLRAFERHVAK